MYSGLVLTKYSGRLMGAHQKIDRVASRHLRELLPKDTGFPSTGDILRFEGKNGPDGIKMKSPAQNEPWHYLDPLTDDHSDFMAILDDHYKALVKHLKANNRERSAFEAAWLAHTVVDGLTPAHHYPYEEKMSELRGGRAKSSRNTKAEKVIFKGDTRPKTIVNTYKAFGPRGLLTSHFMFEWGVMLLIKPLQLPDARPTETDQRRVMEEGYGKYFIDSAREIAVRELYEQFLEHGWTPKLSNEVRHGLAPIIVKTVTVLWYAAAKEAGL